MRVTDWMYALDDWMDDGGLATDLGECQSVWSVFLFPKIIRHSWELYLSLVCHYQLTDVHDYKFCYFNNIQSFSPSLFLSYTLSLSLYINCQWPCHNFLILLNVIYAIEILNLVILIITIIIRSSSSSNNNNSSTSIKSMNSGWIDVDLSFIVVIRFFISICNIQFLLFFCDIKLS